MSRLGRGQVFAPKTAAPESAWDDDTVVVAYAPNAIAASTNLTGAVTAIDEDPQIPDANWLTATSAVAVTDVRVSFPTPVDGAPYGSQNFRVQVRKTAGTPNPTITTELRQNDVLRKTMHSAVVVSSTTGQVFEAGWQASDLVTLLDGSDVEFRLVSVVGQGAGALPAYSSAGTLLDSATMPGTGDVNVPAHTSGDLLILLVLCRNTNNDGTLSAINTAGWTQGGGAGNMYGGTQNARLGFGWKIGNGSETVVNITRTGGTTADRVKARVFRFTAANGFATPPVANIGASTQNSGSTTVTMPSVDPAGALNRRAVALLAMSVSTASASATGEAGGDWTETLAEDAGTNGTITMQTSDQSAGAAISGGTITITSAAWVGIGFTLEPALIPVNTVEIGAVEWEARYLVSGPSEPNIAGWGSIEYPVIRRSYTAVAF